MRVLATGDIHLGRKPTDRPSSLEGWEAVVACAKEQAVDVVVLAGDIIEHDDSWMGIYGPLEEGLKELAQASIQVIAVGGNHDWNILARLMKDHAQVVVLGSDGNWQSHEHDGVCFIGRSFTATHDSTNPFERFDKTLLGKASLSLGVLHTDVGGSSSNYAPTRASDFLQSHVDLWVLGHIHKHGFVAEEKAFYCGSPVALDPGERGLHGLYLLESLDGRTWETPRFIPLSPVRYEHVAIDISEASDVQQAQGTVTRLLRQFATESGHDGDLFIDLLFTGMRTEGIALDEVVGSFDQEGYFLKVDRTTVYIRRFSDATQRPFDLEALGKSGGIDGILARLISDQGQITELYRRLDQESYDTRAFRPLTLQSLDHARAAELAQKAALGLLESMLQQREEG